MSADPFTYTQTTGGIGTSLWFSDWDGGAADCPNGDCQRNLVVDALASPLTNASVGTVVAFDLNQFAAEGLSNNNGFVNRSIISGSVTAVPIPAAVWLFTSALAGLGWMRRKRSS